MPCLVCEGTGWRLRRAGEPAFDEYTGEQVSTTGDKPSTIGVMSSAQVDAELAKILADQASRDGRVTVDEAYGWERQRERRDAAGSYLELERALEKLGSSDPSARHLLGLIFDSGLPVTLDVFSERREQGAVEWLANEMKGKILVPRWAYEQIREKRIERVRQLAKDGGEVSAIARAVGTSQRFVKSVLAGGLQVRPLGYTSGVV